MPVLRAAGVGEVPSPGPSPKGRVIWVPFLPPSLNNMYKTVMKRKGRKQIPLKVPTPELKAFKNKFSAEVVPQYQRMILELAEMMEDPNAVMRGVATVYMDNLVNSTWPESAKNRFKTIDADNRGKATFDAFKEALGDVDDSRIFGTWVDKALAHDETEVGTRLDVYVCWCSDFRVPVVPWAG